MRDRVAFLACLLVLATGAPAEEPAAAPRAQPALTQQAPPPTPPINIHQIDLNPTGTAFSIDKPRLEGDQWVFTILPEKTVTRVKKDRVKKITQRSHDLSKEVVWQLELNPTGTLLAKEEPKEKSGGYTLTTWKEGRLTSVRKADVKSVRKLVGLDAFRAEQLELGSFLLSGELPEGAGTGTVRGGSTGSEAAPASGGTQPGQGTWTYQGKPGVTDAYAPPSAVQSRPGDVPKAPTPK